MERHILQKFFEPNAVAVVGLQPQEGTIGFTLLNNLKKDGFPGRIYPINPNHERSWGFRLFRRSRPRLPASISPSWPFPFKGCRRSCGSAAGPRSPG